LISMLLNALS
jgi:hypothetical protein